MRDPQLVTRPSVCPDRLWPGLLADKPHELHIGVAVVDRQACHGRLQIEPPGSGCARVHDQPPSLALDERLVRVAIHEDVGRVGRQELRWRRTTQLMPVADVNRQPPGLERQALRQQPVQRIDVAVNSLDRRDRAEGVEHRAPANVSRMQNLRDTGERIKQAVTPQTVCI